MNIQYVLKIEQQNSKILHSALSKSMHIKYFINYCKTFFENESFLFSIMGIYFKLFLSCSQKTKKNTKYVPL